MGKLEEKAKEWNDLYFRILPSANKIYDQAFDEVVRLGKIEKKIKQQRIRGVELRENAYKELSNWRERLEKVTKEYRALKDEKDKIKAMDLKTLARQVLERTHPEPSPAFMDTLVYNLALKLVPELVPGDIVKKMSTEELAKKIDILEKRKTFKKATEKRDTTYKDFKEAELEFSIAKEAYDVIRTL